MIMCVCIYIYIYIYIAVNQTAVGSSVLFRRRRRSRESLPAETACPLLCICMAPRKTARRWWPSW